MADLAAGNVTYSFSAKDRQFLGRLGFLNRGTITFGNGALTVPTGGLPLTKAKMGCPRVVKSLKVLESNLSGYAFEYDVSAEKLFILLGPLAAGAIVANVTSNALTGNVVANTVTVAAPTISLGNAAANIADNNVIGLSALANAAALQGSGGPWVGITGVQAPTAVIANVNVSGVLSNVHVTAALTGTNSAAARIMATAVAFAPSAMVCELEVIGY